MRRLPLAILGVCIVGTVGCGGGDAPRLKEENAALLQRLEAEKATAQAAAQRLKNAEDQVARLTQEKGGLEEQLKGRPTPASVKAIQDEKLRAEEAAKKEAAGLKTALAEMRSNADAARTDADNQRNMVETAKKELGEEKAKHKVTKDDATTQMEKVAKLEKQQVSDKASIASLTKRVEELSPNPLVVGKQEAYDQKAGSLIVGFVAGKEKQAELLCKALGFEVARIDGEDKGNRILCRYKGPINAEILRVLSSFQSVIKHVTPNKPIGKVNGGFSRALERSRFDIPDLVPRIAKYPSPTMPAFFADGSETTLEKQWGLLAINAPKAWEVMTPDAVPDPPIVAIIDLGFDTEHPDLRNHFTKQRRSFNSSVRNDSSDDVVPDKSQTNAIQAHGTHCAGIVLSVANRGMRQSRSYIRILPIKVAGPSPSEDDLVSAIHYAREQGAKVISFSITVDPIAGYYHDALYNAVKRVTDDEKGGKQRKGVLFVCAAGNGDGKGKGVNIDEGLICPPCYGRWYPSPFMNPNLERIIKDNGPINSNRIITVGAIGPDGTRSGYSNYGLFTVDLMAPGGVGQLNDDKDLSVHDYRAEIYSTIPGSIDTTKWKHPSRFHGGRAQYASFYGTSMAAPFVAGAAALLMAHPKYRDLPPERIKELLVRNARTDDRVSDGFLPVSMQPKGKKERPRILDLSFVERDLDMTPSTRELIRASRHFGWGLHFFWDQAYRQALTQFHGAIQLEPNNAAYWYFAAFCYALLGDKLAATDLFVHALHLERTKEDVRNWGELVERLQGPHRASVEKARRRYKFHGERPEPTTLWTGWETAPPSGPVPSFFAGNLHSRPPCFLR